MKNRTRIGWLFLIAGSSISLVFLVFDLSSTCPYPTIHPPWPDQKSAGNLCLFDSLHYPEIGFGIALIVTGIVLKVAGSRPLIQRKL